jgi:hypothetical protein
MYFQNYSLTNLEVVIVHDVWLLTDLEDLHPNYASSEVRCIWIDAHETYIYSSLMLLSLVCLT